MKNKNNIIYYLQQAFYNCAYILIGGSVIQGFMLESGISEAKVSLFVSVMQVMQVLSMLLISGIVENIKNIFNGIAIPYAFQSLAVFVMLFLCFKQDLDVNIKYILLFSANIITGLLLGVANTLAYKLPYHIMNIKDYGRISGQSGVIIGICGVIFSGLLSFFIGKFKYFNVMTAFCIVGIIMFLLSAFLMKCFTPIEPDLPKTEAKKINIFKYKPFYILLAPNFFRGFSFGIYNLAAVIGYHEEILDGSGAGLLVTLSQIATIIGCQSYAFLVKKYRNNTLIILSSVGFCVLTPLMLVGGNQTVFAIFYFITYFLVIYISYAIPVLVTEHIDYRCLGQYTAWRMAIYTLGIAIGGACVPLLMEFASGMVILIISGITVLPCGIGYYLFERQALNEKAQKAAE